MSGEAEIDAMIARLRTLGRMSTVAAKDCAAELETQLRANASAGLAPDGSSWKAKKDGGRPLVNAAKAITVVAVGKMLLARLVGPEAWHHFGTGKDPKRQILPTGAMPASIAEAIKRGLVNFWNREVAR